MGGLLFSDRGTRKVRIGKKHGIPCRLWYNQHLNRGPLILRRIDRAFFRAARRVCCTLKDLTTEATAPPERGGASRYMGRGADDSPEASEARQPCSTLRHYHNTFLTPRISSCPSPTATRGRKRRLRFAAAPFPASPHTRATTVRADRRPALLPYPGSPPKAVRRPRP